MFGNFKKKLSTAIQEGIVISENLQQQYRQRVSRGSTPTTPLSPSTESFNSKNSQQSSTTVPPQLNIAAGCELLAKYEQDWDAIRAANESNATKASEVAQQIEVIEQRITAQRTSMTDLITCLQGMPALVASLRASQEVLQEITQLSAQVEDRLDSLQDLCEECELQEFMLQKQCELSQHNQKKMAKLESYRQKVAAEHQTKIQQHEERLRQIQRERQAVFDDAFRDDLAEFKRKGTLTKIQKEPSQEVFLEEVMLEDGETTKAALEDFLNG